MTDPDARVRRTLWALSAAGLAAALALVAVGVRGVPLVFVALLAALALLWPVARAVRFLYHWIADAHHGEWMGLYYEYDGRQIRVLFEDGGEDRIWICAVDVLDALGIRGRARDPERIRQIAGRDALVRLPGTRPLCFTERGLAAWMERRTEPAAGRFRRWLESQVVGPYRRRLEIERLAVGRAVDR